VDATNPELNGAIVKTFDALGGAEKAHKHGTAIAGAIAAHGKLLGIAPSVQVLAARAFDDTPGEAKGTSFAIYKGLQWAADNGARVVNMSFAGPSDPALHRMLAAAYEKGLVLIAAAGNAGPHSAPLYPAADSNVIAVTATDSDDNLYTMANRGEYVAIAAPGVDILAAAPGESYQITTGTSVAAAHVSGVAALLLERNPALKPKEIRMILTTTAKPLGTKGQHSAFGAGLVNAYQAVIALDGKSIGKNEGDGQAKR
jgi:subtilisin family serine protease